MLDEFHSLASHGMVGLPNCGETQGDETRQWNGLQKTSTLRLNRFKHPQAFVDREPTNDSNDRIPRRPIMVNHLADAYERGQGITYYRQSQETKEFLRKTGQLERQGLDFLPGHQAGQGACRQNWNCKGAIDAVPGPHGLGSFRGRLSK